MMDGFGWHGGMMVVMAIFSLVILIGVVGGIVFIARAAGWGRSDRGRAASLLDERFARGEIDEEEFESRRQLLR